MTFKRLPDADLDPHPRLTWLAECCFDLTVMSLYRKLEHYPPDYALHPGTLVISNHQRDADVPILTTALCQRIGLDIQHPLPFYASREDIFRRGFLTDLLSHWPWPFPQLLGMVPLRWLFNILRAEPMRRVREFTFEETLRSLINAGLQDEYLETILRPSTMERLQAEYQTLPDRLKDLDGLKLQYLRHGFWGLRRIQRHAITHLRPEFERTIDEQLSTFAKRLDEGRCVYFAPEGTISVTGYFGRVRHGLHDILERVNVPPLVLPVALSYDALAPGRLRVVVNIGKPSRSFVNLTRAGVAKQVRSQVLGLYTVTLSHLFARFLRQAHGSFGFSDVRTWCDEAISHMREDHVPLDPLLSKSDKMDRAIEARLAWLRRKGILRKAGMAFQSDRPPEVSPGWRGIWPMIYYLNNGLNCVSGLYPRLHRRLHP